MSSKTTFFPSVFFNTREKKKRSKKLEEGIYRSVIFVYTQSI